MAFIVESKIIHPTHTRGQSKPSIREWESSQRGGGGGAYDQWSLQPAVSTLECNVVLLCVCRHRSRTDVSKLQICNAEYDCFCARTTASFWVVADPIICTLRGASPLPVGR